MAKEQLYELGMTKLHIMTQPGLVVIAQISKHTEILNVLDRSASFILIPGQVQCITFVILPSVTLLFTWGIFNVFILVQVSTFLFTNTLEWMGN